jgi:uncharacterized membrane protein
MYFEKYKIPFIVVVAIITLLVASPAIQRSLVYPESEFFSEFWLSDSNHKTENFPYNITQNEYYTVYLVVSNHLGQCSYYNVEIKFRNQTQLGPNILNQTMSPQPILCNISAFLAENETLEVPITFKFNYNVVNDTVYFNYLTINNVQISLAGYTTSWNASNYSFFGKLIFELWLYNSTTGSFQYNARYVDLRLNMTG